MTDETASGLLRELESTWEAIRKRHRELPDVVIILASGTSGRTPKQGHYAPCRWQVNGDDRAEIMVSGEGLRLGARELLDTLLHEAAHVLAAVRGVRETSRQGRYHNEKYARLARELGLEVAKDEKGGWTGTSVPDPTAERYATQIRALERAMVLWRRAEVSGAKKTRSNNLIAAECACERTIRIAASELERAPVMCGACGEHFEPKDS